MNKAQRKQLALALLLHIGIEKSEAVRLHQELKWALIAELQGDFAVYFDLNAWVNYARSEREPIT